MKHVLLLLCLINFSLLAQTADNTAKELENTRARAGQEEQKLLDKEAKQKAKEEAKAQKEAQKTTDNNNNTSDEGYSFFGRNAIGFNFAPAAQISTLRSGVKMISDSSPLELKADKAGFGMGFSYEHRLAKWATLSGDFGFGKLNLHGSYADISDVIDHDYSDQINYNELKHKAKVDLKIDTKAWAVGIRFYTKGNAPFGFFLYPKIGGTIVHLSGSYPEYNGGSFNSITNEQLVQSMSFNNKTHGIYAALELGWRIQLFPKLMAKSPVQIALDISLLDVGYYFRPWTTGAVDTAEKFTEFFDLSLYEKYLNIRIVPLPRLGFTIKF